jgi:hypothetical protein
MEVPRKNAHPEKKDFTRKVSDKLDLTAAPTELQFKSLAD